MILFKKLQTKLKIREDALKMRIHRKANDEVISTKSALIVLASLEGIGIQNELKKLEPEDRKEAQLAILNSKGVKNSTSQKEYSVLRPGFKKKLILEQGNLFLELKMVNEAYKMAEKAYLILYCFENSLRIFINKVMTKDFGHNWWDTKMTTKKLQNIAKEVKRRKMEEKNLYWHSKRGDHELNYSDFNDLRIIIETYKNIFDKYFISRYRESYWITSRISESYPSRNITAHNNPLSGQDIKRLEACYIEWKRQIKYIKSNFTF